MNYILALLLLVTVLISSRPKRQQNGPVPLMREMGYLTYLPTYIHI